jgi:hypothetical protein
MKLREIFVCCGLAYAQILFAAPADDIKALLEKGDAAGAYQLGRKHREQLGDPQFDFYYGIAAVDSGNAGEGVLALERYVLNFPDNVSARLQLARGYFALGEDARARDEFEGLRRLNPPPDIAATIDRYLDAIRLREARYSVSSGAFVELGFGYDSNVNGGVSNANIFLPNLGPVVVAPGGVKAEDGFTNLTAGGYVSYPVAPGVALFANGLADAKLNFKSENNDFDLGNYAVVGGVSVLRDKNLFRFGLYYNYLTLANSKYRDATGASAEWNYQLDERQAIVASVQYAQLRYPGANSARDADFTGLTLGYRRVFNYAMEPIFSASLNAGREDSTENRDDLVRDLWGGRVSVSFTPAAKWGASIGATYQRSDYRAPDIFLGTTREDEYYSIDAGVTYLYSRNLSFRAEATFIQNRSNIELYDFPRELFLLKARYEFK